MNTTKSDTPQIKEELNLKGFSIRAIARDLNLGASTVSDIISKKYKGSESTKEKVLNHIELILNDKVEFNNIINDNVETFSKLCKQIYKPQKFDDSEIDTILEFSNLLRFAKKQKNEKEVNEKIS